MKDRILRLLITLAVTLAGTGCGIDAGQESSPIVVIPGQLTKQDLELLRNRALLGDAHSADRLAYYYALEDRRPVEEHHWWTIAAENGDRGAMRALGVSMPKRNPDDCARSIFWLERASNLYPRWHDEYEEVQAELSNARRNLSGCIQDSLGAKKAAGLKR